MNTRTRAKLDFWIEAAAVLIVCGLLIGGLIYSEVRPLKTEDISIHASDLRSYAAAGSWLAREFSSGNVTKTFFEEQLELTKEKVDTVRETLETSDIVEQARPEAQQVKQLADRVHAAFDTLPTGSRSETDLRDIAVTLKSLEDNLKKEAESEK